MNAPVLQDPRATDKIRYGRYTFDIWKRRVSIGRGEGIALSEAEAVTFRAVAEGKGNPVPVSKIGEALKEFGLSGEKASASVALNKLQRKLEEIAPDGVSDIMNRRKRDEEAETSYLLIQREA